MKICLFYHSLRSDWNHGNAHFLRGIYSELKSRGVKVKVFEPVDGWSYRNLRELHGEEPLRQFAEAYPGLESHFYDPLDFDAAGLIEDSDAVIVHEWNEPHVVKKLGDARGDRILLFHDTHHRSITAREQMARYRLDRYDGVLAYGKAIRDVYLREKWVNHSWVWHEAADIRLFRPLKREPNPEGDLVWIGNWGDGEREAELIEFLVQPIRELGLKAKVYGVRYPERALRLLEESGIEYGGYLPNFLVPKVFSQYRVTIHIPRRPYVAQLPGIPTIRPFEALACGIPLICSPWIDAEHLFRPGEDFLVANSTASMVRQIDRVLSSPELSDSLSRNGRETILRRHTCGHRVDELMGILESLGKRAAVLPADPQPVELSTTTH